mgnify:CR=1 FL=1
MSNKFSARSYSHINRMLAVVETPLDHPFEFNHDGILVNQKLRKIRLFHLQKFNKKSKQTQVIEDGKNITKSEMIRKTPCGFVVTMIFLSNHWNL